MKIETTINENRNNKDFNKQQNQGIVPFPVALQKGTTRNKEKQENQQRFQYHSNLYYIIEATASSLCNNQQQQTNNSKNQQQKGKKLSEWFWNEETDHFHFLIKDFCSNGNLDRRWR